MKEPNSVKESALRLLWRGDGGGAAAYIEDEDNLAVAMEEDELLKTKTCSKLEEKIAQSHVLFHVI